jgi:hypothetical protein
MPIIMDNTSNFNGLSRKDFLLPGMKELFSKHGIKVTFPDDTHVALDFKGSMRFTPELCEEIQKIQQQKHVSPALQKQTIFKSQTQTQDKSMKFGKFMEQLGLALMAIGFGGLIGTFLPAEIIAAIMTAFIAAFVTCLTIILGACIYEQYQSSEKPNTCAVK